MVTFTTLLCSNAQIRAHNSEFEFECFILGTFPFLMLSNLLENKK